MKQYNHHLILFFTINEVNLTPIGDPFFIPEIR